MPTWIKLNGTKPALVDLDKLIAFELDEPNKCIELGIAGDENSWYVSYTTVETAREDFRAMQQLVQHITMNR